MSDALLSYYNNERTHLFQGGREFAQRYPKIAEQLKLGENSCEDPHVERIIDAFCYLTARVRHKIDDDFPEITQSLLNVVYPHYIRPIPSMAVVRMELDRGQGDMVKGYEIARHAMIESEPVDGHVCQFRTCYPLTLWPMEVAGASLSGLSFDASTHAAGATAVLKLTLRTYSADGPFSAFDMQSLRLFLSGQPQHVHDLYELLLTDVVDVVVTSGQRGGPAVSLGAKAIAAVGFDPHEEVIPSASNMPESYRLLTEYFAFPEKFHFIEIKGLTPQARAGLGSQMEIHVYVRRSSAELERNVSPHTLQPGCTPVINLFKKQADDLTLDYTRWEYRIEPDARASAAHEVYSVDRVQASPRSGKPVEYRPFYAHSHGEDRSRPATYWYATRQPTPGAEGTAEGSDVFLSLVDLGFDPAHVQEQFLHVETTCLNRNLPRRLPWGGGRPRLRLRDGGPISQMRCLTQPTAAIAPPQGHAAMWRVISHLSLNYLSLVGGDVGGQTLRELLSVYDYLEQSQTQSRIEAIREVDSRSIVCRAGRDLPGAFCRGVQVTLEVDRDRFPDNGLYLFANVLDRFLGLYCNLNSFTRLVLTHQQKELHRWPPRAGRNPLL